MSQFRKQSINHFIIAILALIFGAINNFYIYIDNLELKGKYDFIVNTSYIIGILFSFGLPMISNKYLPIFKTDDDKNNGFFTFLLFLTTFFSILAIIILVPLSSIKSLYPDFAEKYYSNRIVIIIVSVCTIYIAVISRYLFARKTVDFPLAIINLLNKLYVGASVLLITYNIINISYFELLIQSWFLIAVILLLLLVFFKHKRGFSIFNFNQIKSKLGTDFFPFLLSGMFMYISYSVLDKIDLSMLGAMRPFKESGIYGILNYLSGVILIPFISTYALFGYKISEHAHQNNIKEIKKIYQKTSDYLFYLGIFISIIIWIFIPILPYVSPKMVVVIEYKNVFLILASAHICNMMFSINEHIIVYSKYHMVNAGLVMTMIILNVSLNYFLIPNHGMYGAAVATCISIVFFNLLKSLFIYIKFGIHPFTITTLRLIIFGFCSYCIFYWINTPHVFLTLFLKLLVVSILLVYPLFRFNLSSMITSNVKEMILRYSPFIYNRFYK